MPSPRFAPPQDWNNLAVAHAMARVALGFNFLMHSLKRLPHIPEFLTEVNNRFFVAVQPGSFLPPDLVRFAAGLIPYSELLLAAALLTGFMQRTALLGGLFFMLILIFGCSSIPEWQSVTFQMLYIMFFLFLMATRSHDLYSADGYLRARHRN
jgi:thiosulfate dehydrogenase [quinone] large subunit